MSFCMLCFLIINFGNLFFLNVLSICWHEFKDEFQNQTEKSFNISNYFNRFSLMNANEQQSLKAFLMFMKEFNKRYESEDEFIKKYSIFNDNMKIAMHLQQQEKGTAIYGPTIFADMTQDEFRKTYLNMQETSALLPKQRVALLKVDRPNKFDWRNYNVVTKIKRQGKCGSSWAFSTIANIESAWAIKFGDLISLSEQQIIDCDKINRGCRGGQPLKAYHEIIRMSGVQAESDYPYTGLHGSCKLSKEKIKVYINDTVLLHKNETTIANYLYEHGPVAVRMNADILMLYRKGIIKPTKSSCNPNFLNHGATIIGYGKESWLHWWSNPYWIIKNSWGVDWGENGYFRLYRGNEACGVNRMVTSVIIH